MNHKRYYCMAGAVASLLAAGTAWGQDEERTGTTQPQSKSAEERMQDLEQRVEELESGEVDIESSGGGFSLEFADGSVFEFGGRIMIDYDFYDGLYNLPNDGDEGSEGEFRRTRLELEGATGDWVYVFVVDIDDQGEGASVNDGWIGYTGWGPTLSVGKFKEPISLERLTSSKWITFDERSIVQDAINAGQPDFAGIMLSGYNAGISWAGGVFDNGNEDGAGEDAYALTGRVAGALPFGGESHFLHLGVSGSDRNAEEDTSTYEVRSRLGVHTLGDRSNLFGEVPIEERRQVGLEAAYVLGPFSAQGEYFDVTTDGSNGSPDADVQAYYAQVAYTLTGEPRTYKREAAAFDKIKPASPYGAWEIAARYAGVEGDVDGLDDPEFEVVTLGLNWYANENVKFMLNYLMADTEHAFFDNDGAPDGIAPIVGEEDGDAVTLRAQYVF